MEERALLEERARSLLNTLQETAFERLLAPLPSGVRGVLSRRLLNEEVATGNFFTTSRTDSAAKDAQHRMLFTLFKYADYTGQEAVLVTIDEQVKRYGHLQSLTLQARFFGGWGQRALDQKRAPSGDSRASIAAEEQPSRSPEMDTTQLLQQLRAAQREKDALQREKDALARQLEEKAKHTASSDRQLREAKKDSAIQAVQLAIAQAQLMSPEKLAELEDPEVLVCPVSREIMLEPVMAVSRNIYNRRTIEAIINGGDPKDPLNPSIRLVGEGAKLESLPELRKAIVEWVGLRDAAIKAVEAAKQEGGRRGPSFFGAHAVEATEDAESQGQPTQDQMQPASTSASSLQPAPPALPISKPWF